MGNAEWEVKDDIVNAVIENAGGVEALKESPPLAKPSDPKARKQ